MGERRAIVQAIALIACVSVMSAAGCGGGSTPTAATPPPPVQPTPVPPAPSATWSTSGVVTAAGTAQPIAGATLTPGWELAPVTTDAQGNFQLTGTDDPPPTPYPLTVSAPGTIAHEVWISWTRAARTGVNLSVIRTAAPFSTTFYEQFARDMYDKSEGSPWPLRRWTVAPKFYVRTVDQNGRAVEPEVLTVTLDALRRGVPAYTANTYTAAAIETGTETRPLSSGWINVTFLRQHDDDTPCGRADVGTNPGNIWLYEDVCSCGSVKVPGSVTMHEVGHAMGFWHVADRNSLMYPYDKGDCRAGTLSTAEAHHAGIVYARPRGNTAPDRDPKTVPSAAALEAPGPIVR